MIKIVSKLLVILPVLCVYCDAYKPVVLIPGIASTSLHMSSLSKRIEKEHPGTNVTILNVYAGLLSITTPLWSQIEYFRPKLMKVLNDHPDGIHIVGYSQGSLITRGLIETTPNHNVHTFISLAGPQMGIFGFPLADADYLGISKLTIFGRRSVYLAAYSMLQNVAAPASYWKDPYHYSSYLKGCKFLPVLNNEVLHKNSSAFKENFLQLKKHVMIGSTFDGVVIPWQSSIGGFFDDQEKIVSLEGQRVFLEDSYGLKTMKEDGRLTRHVVTGVAHILMPLTSSVQDIVLEYLI